MKIKYWQYNTNSTKYLPNGSLISSEGDTGMEAQSSALLLEYGARFAEMEPNSWAHD